MKKHWQDWSNLVLGLWVFASLWVLGSSTSVLLMWNAVIVGALVVLLAGRAISPTTGSAQSPAQHV